MEYPPVYLDNHATTPVDPRVVDAMMPFLTQHFGNPASVQHRFGWAAKEAVEIARRTIAGALNARPQEIIFTGSATESNNLAIKGAAAAYLGRGNHIITTAGEHQSVLSSCRALERQGFNITILPVDRFGSVTADDVRNALTDGTIFVSVMSANNEIGTIQPIAEIGNVCRKHGIVFHTDATQTFGKLPVDVDAMGIDLLTVTSHKIHGPKGVGALFVRSRNPRIAVETQMHGAGHEHGLRSGTLNVPGIAGFGKAVQLAVSGMEEEQRRLTALRDRLQRRLCSITGATVNGHPMQRLPNNLSITFPGVSADQLMTSMSDIAVSAGSACSAEDPGEVPYSHVLKAIGLGAEEGRSTIRIGLGRFTTEEEIERAGDRISESVTQLRQRSETGIPV